MVQHFQIALADHQLTSEWAIGLAVIVNP